MYGDFILLDGSRKPEKAPRVFVEDLKGKYEAWLRDKLFNHPELLPVGEIDSAYGPLVPLCRELHVGKGFIDAFFIDGRGQLTIVECKLRKNSQAKHEVIGQTLDYVSALKGWSYERLQEKVSSKSTPFSLFEAVRAVRDPRLTEQQFREAVSRSLRDSRFLVLIVGDGIHENLEALTELVNSRATREFTLGLVELALYRTKAGQLFMQPRVLAKTKIIERRVIHIDGGNFTEEEGRSEGNGPTPISGRGYLKKWWGPILKKRFGDAPHDVPFWVATNNVVLRTPFPGIQIKAFRIAKSTRIGVFVSAPRREEIGQYLARERAALKRQLPNGTEILPDECIVAIATSDYDSDPDKQAWLIETLNGFVNVLHPRLKKWHAVASG